MNSFFDQSTIDEVKAIATHVIDHLPKAIIYLILAYILYRIVKRLITFLGTRTNATFAGPALRANKYIFIFAAIMLVASAYEADLGGIWTMLGTVGALVAVGFVAVWSVLSNISCTVLILFFRPFEVGDELEFPENAGMRGKVHNLNFAYTILRDDEGNFIQIPNNLFFQRIIKRRPLSPPTNPPFTDQLSRKPETPAT